MSQTEIPVPVSEAKQNQEQLAQDLADYKFGWSDDDAGYAFTSGQGLDEDVIRELSARKDEPDWMLDLRLRAYRAFLRRPMPNWGSDLSGIDFDNIHYYVEASEQQAARGRSSRRRSSRPTRSSGSRRRSVSGSSPGSPPSTSRRCSTTRCARTSRRRA